MLLALSAGKAGAASLDSLEVGGAYGTPGTTDATALWWNPAGLAAGHGTRITLEGAPTFAVIKVDRADPHGGPDQIKLQGVVPFAGVATDLGVDGLGLGLGFALPFVRGGTQTPQGGPVRYALRDGQIQTAALLAGAGYDYKGLISLGVGGQLMLSQWGAKLDNELMPDLSDQIGELGQDAGYTDADLENPDYAATLDFQELTARAVSYSAGLRFQPDEHVALSLAYLHGFHLNHSGDVSLAFSCPPQSDTLGRFGAESRGLCDTTMQGAAQVSYDMPGRVQGSVRILPTQAVSIEAMGGLVFWHVFSDYRIQISEIGDRNPDLPQSTVDLVQTDQLWARDNQDSYWLGVDAKGTIHQRLTLGGRLLYDKAAAPDSALLANNYDANTVILGGLVAGNVLPWLELGLSWSHYFLATRTVTDSAFSMSVDPALRPETRYNYPHGNGTYSGAVDRLGISARLAL
ncbi:MAG: hypothetical protein GXP62_18415 [Oligoflexia bacterium]|nr:hypothetical protein [Oligoflexia bacterium]